MKEIALKTLPSLAGEDLGCSDWVLIDQERINAFADVTEDHQFIHVDLARAAESPFGGTIAHGFLTLSLLSYFLKAMPFKIVGTAMAVNYGFDKIRMLSPVPSGARVRGCFKLADVQEKGDDQLLLTYGVSVEIEGADKPALVADWLCLLFKE